MRAQPQEPEVRVEKRSWARRGVLFFLLLAARTPAARANVTVLLEEPYSYDGAFAGTGHTALYFSRVCAATPVTLRRCNPGERGVVISRYTRIAGYDWIAIPLVPYLYAVENAEDVPLYADPKLAAFLRDQYRRAHLEDIAPDGPGGETPKGDWYELVGSSYDRTNYGFEIETTPEQDDAFIAWINSRPNHANYQFMSRNCADFVRDVLNFYYPNSVSRASVVDLFVGTPKHAAKSLARYGHRHPDLEFSRFVIPQVPGTVKRSRPVRGVLESLFRAKKYVVVLAAFHPFVAGGVMTVDLIGERFNPSKKSLVFSLEGKPSAPLTETERRSYSRDLRELTAENAGEAARAGNAWRKFVESSRPGFNAYGRPVLQSAEGAASIQVSLTRADLRPGQEAAAELQKDFIVARLKQTLSRSRAPRISSNELHEDWLILKNFDAAGNEKLSGPPERGNQTEGENAARSSD